MLERCQSVPTALRVQLQTKPPELPAAVVARRSWASADIKRFLVGGHLNLAKRVLHDAANEDRADNWFRHIEALPSNARGTQGIIADVIYLSNEAEMANGNVALALNLLRELEEAERREIGDPAVRLAIHRFVGGHLGEAWEQVRHFDELAAQEGTIRWHASWGME